MRRAWILMSLFAACVIAAVSAGCLDMLHSNMLRTHNADWLKTQQARIIVAGKVVDEAGHPLRRVRMSVVKLSGRPAPNYDSPRWREERIEHHRTIDADFHVEYPIAMWVELRFSKTGYATEKIEIHVEPTTSDERRAPTLPPADPVVRDDIIVTLRRAPG